MPVKRAKSARRERQKLVAVFILGICLLAVLMWPAAETDDGATAGGENRATARRGAPAGSSHVADPEKPITEKLGGARAAHAPELPRIDSDAIAAADPFTALPLISSASGTPGEADEFSEEAIAAVAARDAVRAVYRTSRGAAAIVNDEIIPVKDAKHWIATLRAAD